MSVRDGFATSCGLQISVILLFCGIAAAEGIRPPGFRPQAPALHALVGARIIPRPGELIERGTIILDAGRIVAVGSDLAIPPGARVWDASGRTIVAGLIEPYYREPEAKKAAAKTDSLADDDLDGALRSGFFGIAGSEVDPGDPGPGPWVSGVHPERMIADELTPNSKRWREMREAGFTAACFVPAGGVFRGQSALALLAEIEPGRALVAAAVFQHIDFSPPRAGGRERAYPASLMGGIALVRQTLLDSTHDEARREAEASGAISDERITANPALVALGAARHQRQRVVFDAQGALNVPQAARIADEFQLDAIVRGSGEEWRRLDLIAGAGRPLILPLDFPELPRLPTPGDEEEFSLEFLRAWDLAPENPALVAGLGLAVALTTDGLKEPKEWRAQVELAIARGLSEDLALAALTTVPATLMGVADRMGAIVPGLIANLTIFEGDAIFDAKSRIAEVWIEGVRHPGAVKLDAQGEDDEDEEEGEDTAVDQPKDDESRDDVALLRKTRTASAPPLVQRAPLLTPGAVLFRDATLWTCSPAGRIPSSDLLVVGGKIHAIGADLEIPAGLADETMIIDAAGRHLTPGLIDCHNHSMIFGGVNEGTLPSTAMVRIADVVNSETENLHQQLAGGLTTANLLHGSANPIGGQNCVIKLREGEGPDGLVFAAAPAGIKFALGENVKQANWGEKHTTRFPQTRMGVRTFFTNRFTAAQHYLEAIARAERDGTLRPRRDLELEALGEILRGERLIHCHSYRQDEILMLIRVMEEFGVRIGTFQHVLEGYKVADEIAAHGAGGSCFSDWWGYKFEVYDAIPYAGALMHERGVLVSFNSDSADTARRLNTEAAKAVRYGGVAEDEALAFVTINPARQLGIDSQVGSLEVGKDADLALWSESPLSTQALCMETWIEGKLYFARAREAARHAELASEHEALLAKARALNAAAKRKRPGADANEEKRKWERFFQRSIEDVQAIEIMCCGDAHDGGRR